MKTTPPPTNPPSRRAKTVKFFGRSLLMLALLSVGNHYVPVIDGVTAATRVISSPPTLAIITNNADIGNNATVTVTEGQTARILIQAGDAYGYAVQVSSYSSLPAGAQIAPSNSNYGVNPQLMLTWTPALGTAASKPSTALSFGSYNYYNGLATFKAVNIKVVKWSPSLDSINCLFNWAEQVYPDLLTPVGYPTTVWTTYTYRWYAGTNSAVGVSSVDNHVYYLGTDGQMYDEGPITDWLPQAGCQ